MTTLYHQMWFHVFFGMILYQVVGSFIDFHVARRLEKKYKHHKKTIDDLKDLE